MRTKLIGLTALVCFVSIAQLANAQNTKRLFVLDATGSMASTHEGENSTRFNVALKDYLIPKATTGLEFGRIETSVVLFSGRFPSSNNYMKEILPFAIYSVADIENLLNANDEPNIDQYPDLYPYGGTPLADAQCAAIRILEDVTALEKAFYIYTDGEENASSGVCAKESGIEPEHEFSSVTHDPDNPDISFKKWTWSTEEFIEQKGEPTEYDYDWMLQYIWGRGRYYGQSSKNNPDIAVNKDWSGGVRPGSWPWKVYYRMASNEDLGDPSTDIYDPGLFKWYNRHWDPDNSGNQGAVGRQDVIGNVVTFYEDIVDSPKSSFSMETPIPLAPITNVVRLSEESYKTGSSARSILNAASDDATMSTKIGSLLDPKELAWFNALTEMTNGESKTVQDSQEVFVEADINADGIVNETDLRLVLTWFGRPVDVYNPQSKQVDLFNDGFINNLDISSIRNNWTDVNKQRPIVGDIDYNWCVDKSDLNKIWQWYGRTPASGNQEFHHADLNGDGFVNRDDVKLYYEHEGEGC